mmetsp:Transcript_9239/g.10668  ORF Transcript_9239/g.10668 Transcript_9239/m.10668 type:complete len:349 (+) Transcript_9239:17-1063(+)
MFINKHILAFHVFTVSILLTCSQLSLVSAGFGDVAIGAIGLGCIGIGCTCLKVVTTGEECLVERFGKYNRRLGAGYHLIFRPFESVSFQETTREQVMDVPPQQCYTLDNAPLKADAVVYMRVFSLESARYAVADMQGAVLNLCLTQLREAIGKLTLDESFSSRDRINKALLTVMNSVCQTWGVEITRVEIQGLEPSPDILAAMELQMAAERKKRASILQSEGERATLINQAEGRATAVLAEAEANRKKIIKMAEAEADRNRIEAEGIKVSIEKVATAILELSGNGENTNEGDVPSRKDAIDSALQLIMFVRYMETQAKFSTSNSSKVLMFPTKDSIPLTQEAFQSMLN